MTCAPLHSSKLPSCIRKNKPFAAGEFKNGQEWVCPLCGTVWLCGMRGSEPVFMLTEERRPVKERSYLMTEQQKEALLLSAKQVALRCKIVLCGMELTQAEKVGYLAAGLSIDPDYPGWPPIMTNIMIARQVLTWMEVHKFDLQAMSKTLTQAEAVKK